MKTLTATLAILLMGVSGAAFANRDDHRSSPDHRGIHEHHAGPGESKGYAWHPAGSNRDTAMQAPEIDPASLMTGLTLLGGGLLVLRGRRPKTGR